MNKDTIVQPIAPIERDAQREDKNHLATRELVSGHFRSSRPLPMNCFSRKEEAGSGLHCPPSAHKSRANNDKSSTAGCQMHLSIQPKQSDFFVKLTKKTHATRSRCKTAAIQWPGWQCLLTGAGAPSRKKESECQPCSSSHKIAVSANANLVQASLVEEAITPVIIVSERAGMAVHDQRLQRNVNIKQLVCQNML